MWTGTHNFVDGRPPAIYNVGMSGIPLEGRTVEHLGHIDFYEIVVGETVIADIGIFRSEDDMTRTQPEADELAARLGATAHYDRCCEAYLPS